MHVGADGGSSSLQGRGEADAAEPGELVSSRGAYAWRYKGGVLLSSRTFYAIYYGTNVKWNELLIAAE